jgi:Asp-tRNA(Asn)/Glu-tRNA(Gln) amidotransferase A subunit family amidase
MIDNIEIRLAPLAANLRHGHLSLTTYLEQLEAQFAVQEAQLQAFVPEEGRFERLRREAAALEARYLEPASRPPLYGVLIGVKDIFNVEGFLTRAGSGLPVDLLTGPEAESVTKLKQSGALILGKTVTTEFAYFAPGPTRNPCNLAHTPGGSSSGSAAAVGAGLCPLALGSQTIGSILRPASFCGVVGFKPSFGRISSAGVIPFAVSLDHIGFFTRDVTGATLAAAVLCKNWGDEEARLRLEAQPEGTRGDGEAKELLNYRPVLGVPSGPYLQKASPEGLAHFYVTQKKLEQAGFEVRPVEVMPNFEQIASQHQALAAGEAALVHRDWYAQFSALYHPKTAGLIERGQQVSPEQLTTCRVGREQLRQELITLMAEHGISAWISPAAVGAAPASLESTGDPIMNLPWTYAGLPAISLPSGFSENGLPLGLQLVAGWYEDEKLLRWAEQIAQALA